MRISGVSQRICGFGCRLARDERGAVLVYVSIALTVFMGFAALVIDGGRLFTLDTEMQSAADALALAGAAELDGNTDAQDRAIAAMNNLVQNSQTFGTGAAAITSYAPPRFLSELPDDDQPITDDYLAPDQASTRFVEVRLTDRAMDSMFATAIGGTNTPDAGAVAVAGFTSAVCKFTPLFMCNPYGSTSEFLNKVGTPAEKRRIIALKTKDPLFPGNFGFLGSISNEDSFKESLAKTDPGACFEKKGVDTEPGNKVSARTALNTRFDMYSGNFGKHKNDPDYRPARDVIKGYTGGTCNPKPEADTSKAFAFPVDSDVLTAPKRMGNGDWSGKFNTYWTTNHSKDFPTPPHGWSSANLPSRYDVYRWEIDTGHIPKIKSGEDGHPQCSKSAVSDDPDRRIIYAAVIDCTTYAGVLNGHETDIPVISFVKMFMTQPLRKKTKAEDPGCDDAISASEEKVSCDDTLFVEMIDKVEPGIDDAVVHDIVQLYR